MNTKVIGALIIPGCDETWPVLEYDLKYSEDGISWFLVQTSSLTCATIYVKGRCALIMNDRSLLCEDDEKEAQLNVSKEYEKFDEYINNIKTETLVGV